MGLLVIANLASRGLGEIIACDVLDSRLQLAKEMGATVTLNARRSTSSREVKAITGGRMCDVAFEGIGKPVGVALTSKVIRNSPPPGNIVLYGYHAGPDLYDLSLWGPKAPVILSLHPEHSPDQKRDLEIAMQAIARGLYPLEEADLSPLLVGGDGEGLRGARESAGGVYQGDRDALTPRPGPRQAVATLERTRPDSAAEAQGETHGAGSNMNLPERFPSMLSMIISAARRAPTPAGRAHLA